MSVGRGFARLTFALMGSVQALETRQERAQARAFCPFQTGPVVRLMNIPEQYSQAFLIARSAQRVTLLLKTR